METNESTAVQMDSDDAKVYGATSKHTTGTQKFRWYEWLIWSILFLLAFFAFFLASRYYTVSENAYPDFLKETFKTEKPMLYIHIFPSSIAMIIVMFQFNKNLRQKYINFHIWNGKIYSICALFGSIGGVGLAMKSYGGLNTHLGFALLGIMWLSTTMIAIYYIKFSKQEKSFRIEQHRIWMIRSLAMIMAAPMLRIWGPIFSANHSEYDAYAATAWFSWVPNMIIAELYIWWRRNYVTQNL